MTTKMVTTSNFELTTEERASLRNEIMNLLRDYNYHPTENAVNKIIDTWEKSKGWMVELFKKHPNYNGKYQIAFDADYDRLRNQDSVYIFRDYLRNVAQEMQPQIATRNHYTYKELAVICSRLGNVYSYMEDIEQHGYSPTANGKTIAEIRDELVHWRTKRSDFRDDPTVIVVGDCAYEKASYIDRDVVHDFSALLYSYKDHIADDDFARRINRLFPTVKAVSGQKVSRIVGKVCKLLGLDKDPDYNKEYAKYSDAINPLAIKRHTVLSCHPVDYLTMSFGNSWASCHTIDKDNDRGMPDDYGGCYSSGTLSYMLDNSSFVFYTVDKDYDGNMYELQDKINRNMFHMGEDKLIQARVYPQGTDGATNIYRQIREIAQKVVADALEVPNLWKNVKGTSECCSRINSYGTHYRDYEHFDDSNVSYLKNDETEDFNKVCIVVGHSPICPSCGRTHDEAETIECVACWDGQVECDECGYTSDSDNMYEIDGRWYCCDCSFYCNYHERREVGDYYARIDGYGCVCEDALDDEGTFVRCERCGDICLTDNVDVMTEDGRYYCCGDCANKDGYVEADDDKWYPTDEVLLCEHCDCYVHVSNWNEELGCCKDCEDEVKEEGE